MLKFTLTVGLLLGASATVHANDSDAVNERIPVRNDEMEAHWGLDCAATWQLAQKPVVDCRAAAELQKSLQLCAFIYQPPGEPEQHGTRDFQGTLQSLINSGLRNCSPNP